MSVVSDQGRSVVLHNIVMVIRHHLKNIFDEPMSGKTTVFLVIIRIPDQLSKNFY